MVLSQTDIKQEMKRGEIAFTPELEEQQWGPASINLRLGFQFTKLREVRGVTVSVAEGIDPALKLWDDRELKERDAHGERETYELAPGKFVLAKTYESIRVPKHLIARVEGRSTYARMGLSMHQTAPWVQPGWSGTLILEIANLGSLTVKLTPLVDHPCQLTFFRLVTPVSDELAYGSRPMDRYQNQEHALASKGSQAPKAEKRGPRKR